MSRRWGYITAIIVFVLSVFFVNCGNSCGVTETCNPTGEGSYQPTSGGASGDGLGIFDGEVDPTSSPSDEGGVGIQGDQLDPTDQVTALLDSLCESLSNCEAGISVAQCVSNLDSDTNLLLEFGVNTTTYQSFTEVQDAITAHELAVSASELSICASAIDALSCDAFESADFSDVFLAVPDDC